MYSTTTRSGRLTFPHTSGAVSYTHLDVYKRQGIYLFNSINESGYVTGGEKDRQWYVLNEDGNKKAFKNPLDENRYNMQALLRRYRCV